MRTTTIATALLLSQVFLCQPLFASDAAPPAYISTAVADTGRPAKDKEQDARRKPAETLAFFGIKPGMQVLDVLAGGGYFTEITAKIVGEKGKVYALNNLAWRQFLGKDIEARYADKRLPNVEEWDHELDDMGLKPESLDAAILIQGFHDFYFTGPQAGNWPKVDAPAVLKALHTALKPGGVLGIVDHAAKPGNDIYKDGSELHRITPERTKELIQAAGFKLDAESDLLRNPADDHSKNVFDPAVRGKTDQFMLRFRKS
ncbi:MAG: class I SAM-dependent methyltransferase [Gammaproteobacteria bacterium]|nr:class I SAM-dependent methyltransferase [Gammaproteobacteria bacterium]